MYRIVMNNSKLLWGTHSNNYIFIVLSLDTFRWHFHACVVKLFFMYYTPDIILF